VRLSGSSHVRWRGFSMDKQATEQRFLLIGKQESLSVTPDNGPGTVSPPGKTVTTLGFPQVNNDECFIETFSEGLEFGIGRMDCRLRLRTPGFSFHIFIAASSETS
jgi:hypothetical protein